LRVARHEELIAEIVKFHADHVVDVNEHVA
jgi:hypothetical protein